MAWLFAEKRTFKKRGDGNTHNIHTHDGLENRDLLKKKKKLSNSFVRLESF